jgi:hypothetical protein
MAERMNVEGEITSLAAETMALQLVLTSLMSKMQTMLPNGRDIVVATFEEADAIAEAGAMRFGKEAAPGHVTSMLRIIQQLREATLKQ